MNRTLRCCFLFFFFNDTATTEIYTLSLHDALPISGFGITYLSGVAFTLEERIVFGAVLGAMTVALTTFVPALLIRDLTLITVLLGLAVALGAGALGLLRGRSVLSRDWKDLRARWLSPPLKPGHPWPLAAVFLICA